MRFDYPAWQQDMNQERRAMRRGPRPKTPMPDNATQGVLFAGMTCLPGQQDLFATDGEQQPSTLWPAGIAPTKGGHPFLDQPRAILTGTIVVVF